MRLLRSLSCGFAQHSKYCIVGGGTGGLNLAAHLLRSNVRPHEIRMFEPAQFHYYQPGWTMVGSNLTSPEATRRPMKQVLPAQVPVVRSRVAKIEPSKNQLSCDGGEQFTYDNLILASGLQLCWDRVKGLKDMLQNPDSKVCSIYEYKYASKTGRLGKQFIGSKAIFTQPAMPIKCAGAPQKILYLWSDMWQTKGLKVDVEFFKHVGVMFGIPKYSEALAEVAKSYNIKVTFKHSLLEVTTKQAIFQNLDTKEKVTRTYDFLHVTPPMSAHAYIAESGLADGNGYLDLDKHTLRHKKYPNVWGLGDCTNLPNSKTAAAVFAQTLALHQNLMALRDNPLLTDLKGRYEGYASCPLFVGRNKLLLAEFKYDGVVDETFFADQEKPRYFFYLMKKYFFPLAYWQFVPRGLWSGRSGIRWI